MEINFIEIDEYGNRTNRHIIPTGTIFSINPFKEGDEFNIEYEIFYVERACYFVKCGNIQQDLFVIKCSTNNRLNKFYNINNSKNETKEINKKEIFLSWLKGSS